MQDLYSAKIAVGSQSKTNREAALEKAMQQVIVKVTGSTAVSGSDAVADMIKNAKKYVQSYRYKRANGASSGGLFGGSEHQGLELSVEFGRHAVDRALRAANQPLWGRERPATLVWLAYKKNASLQRMVTTDSPGSIRAQLQRVARQRGIRLIFPLMDVKDQNTVNFADIWGQFMAPIDQASGRYQPDGILVGRIDTSRGGVGSRWTLTIGKHSDSWYGSDNDLARTAQNAISHLADLYASRFAIRDNDDIQSVSSVKIAVSGINSIKGYSRVSRYLRSLNALASVSPMQFDAGSVTFDARVKGTIDDLKRTIAFGSVLRRDNAGVPAWVTPVDTDDDSGPVTLRFDYQR